MNACVGGLLKYEVIFEQLLSEQTVLFPSLAITKYEVVMTS